MKDDEIINFNNDGSYYPFFQMVLVLINVSVFGDAFNPEIKDDIPEGFNLEAHNNIIEKFTHEAYKKGGLTSITLVQLLYLMTATDKLCKLLLSDNADLLKMKMLDQMPDLVDDWDQNFLSAAQVMFRALKDYFKNYPEYDQMLKIATDGF